MIVKINHFNSILLKNVDNQDDDGDDGSDVNERKLLWMQRQEMRRTRTERLAFPTFVILPPPLDEDDRDKDDPDEDYHDNDKIVYEG